MSIKSINCEIFQIFIWNILLFNYKCLFVIISYLDTFWNIPKNICKKIFIAPFKKLNVICAFYYIKKTNYVKLCPPWKLLSETKVITYTVIEVVRVTCSTLYIGVWWRIKTYVDKESITWKRCTLNQVDCGNYR